MRELDQGLMQRGIMPVSAPVQSMEETNLNKVDKSSCLFRQVRYNAVMAELA
jgi:hypothetical protein